MTKNEKDQAECLRNAARCLAAAADAMGQTPEVVRDAQLNGLLRHAAVLLVWRSGTDMFYALESEVDETKTEE